MAEQEKDTPAEKPREEPEEHVSVTEHSIRIEGREIAYKATAGTLLLREEVETGEAEDDGHLPKASVFFIAYTRTDVDAGRNRPVTFSFNGGPGSSSVWLHLGVLGPKRVEMDEMGNAPPPPYRLVDNAHSLLEGTDLVFIDPVSTGFSRAIPGEKPSQFHEIEKDIESVGEFIRLYVTRNQRWSSPKFLIGESYGTTRAAGLAGFLQERHGMYINGVMLVSSILNFQTARFEPGNDLPYILFLPTYTATAWYHQRLPEDLQRDLNAALEEVEAFALNEYALALMQGDALPLENRGEIVDRLARFTGLQTDYIERTNLRIEIMRFTKELLRPEGKTVGRLDSRFTGIDRDSAGEQFEYDPSYAAIQGPYTGTFNDYVRRELGFESDLPYEILTDRVRPWSFEKYQNQYVDVAETLRKAVTQNPHLRIFVANGYYDLATPYFATHYTFNHLGLDASLRPNISMGHYEAGHMMYLHQPSLIKLNEDLTAFIRASLPP